MPNWFDLVALLVMMAFTAALIVFSFLLAFLHLTHRAEKRLKTEWTAKERELANWPEVHPDRSTNDPEFQRLLQRAMFALKQYAYLKPPPSPELIEKLEKLQKLEVPVSDRL